MIYQDTIAAIATPIGTGGVGIVRMSGKDALAIARKLFTPHRYARWKTHQMRYGIVHTSTGERVDEALAVWMRGPRSFTGEDVVEVSCHGGPLVMQTVLDLALAGGARQANPGEFTMRAFLNGRIDLTQAEATLDVITARTSQALALAQAQLGGWLSQQVHAIRHEVIDALAYVTAQIDFPEDELGMYDIAPPLQRAIAATEQLLATADEGMIYREGARVALVGVPNVGKSSLLNALLRTERAIVTAIPGTTRDTLEETANIHGIPVVLVDTAGITETDDVVEQIGVTRSHSALAQADLVLFVLDSTRPLITAEYEIAQRIDERTFMLVLNKSDLVDVPIEPPALPKNPSATVAVSAYTGAGLDTLTATMARLLGRREQLERALITNPRHRDVLHQALGALRDAHQAHATGSTPDVLAVDLSTALTALDDVTGTHASDDLLNAIFSRFCIGK